MAGKLVRDKIPELIKNSGEKPIIRVLEDPEYQAHLEKKLDEEVAEFHADKNLEELADILEVVCALANALGYDLETLRSAYQMKHEARGGFQKKIYLVGKE